MYACIATILLACVYAGCAASGSRTPAALSSFVDPAFRAHTFSRIAVVADIVDLGWRLKLERTLAETFRVGGTYAVEGTAIIPPTREWDVGVAHAGFITDSIGGLLTLEIIASGEWANHIPVETSTTVSRESEKKKKRSGDTAEHEEVTITTTTEQKGGYTEYVPWTRYVIRLIDVATGQVAWMATNQMSGNMDNQLQWFCREIVVQLQRDGLVQKRFEDSLAVRTGD